MLEINKIHHGDCLDLMKDIPDNSIDMVLTDIPYNSVNMKTSGIRVFDKGLADKLDFDLHFFVSECCRVAKGSIYIYSVETNNFLILYLPLKKTN